MPGPEVEPLDNTPDGELRIDDSGHAFRASYEDTSRPSLSGSYSGPGGAAGAAGGSLRGLGGSVVGSDAASVGGIGFPSVKGHPQAHNPAPVDLDALMAQYQFTPGPSAVQPALDRTNMGPPDWLVQYMEKTPNMGTFGVDPTGYQSYSMERDLLRKSKRKLKPDD